MTDSAPRTPAEHRATLAGLLRAAGRRPSTEIVPAEQALGRVLAVDLLAEDPSPRFDNSQMDGYLLSRAQVSAGRAAESADGAREFRVGPEIAAGADPEALVPEGWDRPGQDVVLPVMTGARLPAGAGAVVPVEKTAPAAGFPADEQGFVGEGGRVSIPPAPLGQFLRPAGSDLPAGAVLLPAGRVLDPAALAVAASQGIGRLPVRARPRVLLCTGGDEVGGAGELLGPAQVPDANGPLLRALSAQWGAQVVGHVRTSDDPRALTKALRRALAELAGADLAPDLVVSAGGISHGRHEVLRQTLLAEGREVWLGHVAQQPGGPQASGLLDRTPLVGLPGNPVSALVSFRVLLAPVLAEVFGAGPVPATVRARLAERVAGIPGKTQFRRARLRADGAGLVVSVVGGPGSHLLVQAAGADALVAVPPSAECAAGEELDVLPLAPLPFAGQSPAGDPNRPAGI